MNTQDPTQLPSGPMQGGNMGTTDMSSLLWGQDQQAQDSNSQDAWAGDSEMYKKVIEALMEKVQSKYGELNAAKFSGKNQNDAQKNDILKTIFETMKAAGVDPADPEAINAFMAELEQSSPDLYELFTEALNGLLGPDTTVPDMQPVDTTLPVDPNQWQPQSPEDPTQSPPDNTMSPEDFPPQQQAPTM